MGCAHSLNKQDKTKQQNKNKTKQKTKPKQNTTQQNKTKQKNKTKHKIKTVLISNTGELKIVPMNEFSIIYIKCI